MNITNPKYSRQNNLILQRLFVVLGLLVAAFLASLPMYLPSASAQAGARKERGTVRKPQKTVIRAEERHDTVIVKFQEGTRLRIRGGRFVFDPTTLSADERHRLARVKVDHAAAHREVAVLNKILKQPGYQTERLFPRPEADLEREQQRGEHASNKELANLNLYYDVHTANATVDVTEQLIDRLNALQIVEIAYAQPIGQPADIAPATPSYEANQGYLNAAPNGIDARYAWTIPGGRGDGVRVIDIENGWRLDHADLPATFFQNGTSSGDLEHGTAVLANRGTQ